MTASSPVMQTRFGRNGNCVAACLATLAGCELARVDFTALEHPKDWDEIARQKLRPLGLGFIHIPGKRFEMHGGDCLYIAHGLSPRANIEHAVILRGDRLVHDPHPDGGGILSVTGVSFVVPWVEV